MMLKMSGIIDIIVPRGGASLIERVQREGRIPVIAHLEGLCHTYIDRAADPGKARSIVLNAKMRRVSICGATETLLVDRPVAATVLPPILADLRAAGCELRGDPETLAIEPQAVAATEAVKLLVEAQEQLRRTLLSFDLWSNQYGEVTAARPRAGCSACGERKFLHLAGKDRPQVTLCGRNSVQIHERARTVDLAEMSQRLKPHGTVRHNDFVLKFWHEPYEMTLFPDGRAIIKGTTDTTLARSLYARYVGS
jgi:hypothetical protein